MHLLMMMILKMKMLFMNLIDIVEIKKKNELWFGYIQAHRIDDVDECAYDYF